MSRLLRILGGAWIGFAVLSASWDRNDERSRSTLLDFFATQSVYADPDFGTITDVDTMLTYTGGPYTAVNPSNNIESDPDCDLVPDSCDDFLLTVDLPVGYAAAHPNHVITVSVSWPNIANDFDVYFQDPNTGVTKHPPAASSANPELAALPIQDGTTVCRIRVLAFSTVNGNFTAKLVLTQPTDVVPGLGTYNLGTDSWTCNTHLVGPSAIPGPPPTVFDHSQDAEPSVRFDGNGKAYVTAIAGVPAGAGLWGVEDACGQFYDWYGAPDAGIGGGDSDVETATELNALGFYNVYMSSLTLANITTSVSFDGGQTFTVQPISTITPLDDRQWNAAHGANTLYLSYRNGVTQPGNLLEVVRWDNGGLGVPGTGPFVIWTPPVDPTSSKQLGNMATDRRSHADNMLLEGGPDGEGNVYHGWTEQGSRVYVSVSKDFGVTWSAKLVYDAGAGGSTAHLFTWVTVDQAGNVYTTWSDDRNVYYAVSPDQGDTWSRPFRVNRGGDSNISIFPQMAGGSDGRVVFTWYGHSGTSSQDPSAVWGVFTSRCHNALEALQPNGNPIFEEMQVNDRPFHSGRVCQDGLGCPCCRQLLECFEIDINPLDGSSFVVYASGSTGAYITRQVDGKSAIDGLTVSNPGGCPLLGDLCVPPDPTESVCQLPGRTVTTDPLGDVSDPGTAQHDIERVQIAEPFAGAGVDQLVVTMKVDQLSADPLGLPANTIWYILWDNPSNSTRYFVAMRSCNLAQIPEFVYGTVAGNMFTTIGPLPPGSSGTYSPDGTIQITVDKAIVGSPQSGETLTNVVGEARLLGGANCTGVITVLDATTVGVYVVRGNTFCPTVACPDAFLAEPGSHGLDFDLTNHASVARFFDVTLSDEKGWLVGGPIETTLGPVAAGATQTFSATVQVPVDCVQGETNEIVWQVADETDPLGLREECSTVVTCNSQVALLVSDLQLQSSGDGVNVSWRSDATGVVRGFDLYRSLDRSGPWEKINRSLIPFADGGRFDFHDAVAISGPVHYRLHAHLTDGTQAILGTMTLEGATAARSFAFRLAGANPVRGRALLSYALPQRVPVRIDVYNVAGQRIDTLVDRFEGPGAFAVSFDPHDAGRSIGSGVYLVRIQAGSFDKSVRVVVVD